MPVGKKRKVSAKKFVELIDAIVDAYGLSEEVVIDCLSKAFITGYRNNVRQKDVLVRVDINKKKGEINLYNQKHVVNEVEDDFLEISLEDAREVNSHIAIGDLFEIKEDLEELNRNASNLIVKKFQELINEEVRNNVFEKFKDKKDDMVVGEVERVDTSLCIIKIDGVSADMPRREQIPNETLELGSLVKVYVKDVTRNNKGSQITVSRSDNGLLKRLFEAEITEIYDGIVEIRSIAREPGERAKVAVSSRNENIDAPGACIGQKGSRIQKITSQLNNEKIDVIQYYDEPELYIAEALKPAEVYGLAINKETRSCVAIVPNDEYSVAIGQRGQNARLAVKLTNWRIDIKTVDEALNLGLEFRSLNDIKRKMKEEQEAKQIEEIKKTTETFDFDLNDDILGELNDLTEEEVVNEQLFVEDDKTKTTKKARGLDSLMTSNYIPQAEKELEEMKRIEKEEKLLENTKKKEEKVEEKKEVKVTPNNYMPVYTDEELEALDAEDEEVDYDDEEVDYDEYDKYYE
ncbi:MAG: transcription termination factor NusA [Bacilli bacterium]|nr:transcription termination factor NusA [Bacilli bacterium]